MRAIIKWIFMALLGVFTFSISVMGQVSISQFLLTAQSDPKVKTFNEQIDYLQKRPYRLSAIQNMEFRTSSNQLDPNRQDYALRFNPANPWEVKNNNKYFSEFESLLWLDQQMALKSALFVRYNHILEYLILKEMKDLEAEKKGLVEHQLAIMEAQRFSDFFKAESYLELKLDLIDKSTELEEAQFEINDKLLTIQNIYPHFSDSLPWNMKDIVTIERIKAVVDSLNETLTSSISLSRKEKQISLTQAEYNLEKSNINLGFMQAQYQHYRIEQNRSPWNLSLGFTIPITNPNKGDMAKRRLETIEAQNEKETAETEILLEKNLALNQLSSLIQQHQELKKKIESLENGTFLGTLEALSDSNPLPSIRFKSNLLKLKAIEVKIKNNIYQVYISYLESTDQLQQTPLINFLSPTLNIMQ